MVEIVKGYVQVYTGSGKGKTTAALGTCLRAAGHGIKSHVIQFMKGQVDYGELFSVKMLGGMITLTQGGRDCFVSKDCPAEIDVKMAGETLETAREVIRAGQAGIVVLDEACVAMDFKLIEVADVLALIDEKPECMEMILTGRGAPPEIIERADLVTEMREVKHYWTKGVAARKGVEC